MHRYLFLTLSSFSQTGGIEKFNRAFMKAFVSLTANHPKLSFRAAGMYDEAGNENYIPSTRYQAGKGKRWAFVCRSVWASLSSDELILGHINLAPIAVFVKWFKPSVRLTLICHGIEVFSPLSGFKRKLLQKANRLLAVSSFTREQLIKIQGVPKEKIILFPNTLDPYFPLPVNFAKPAYLQQRYGLAAGEKILFTLTRLDSDEGYKGYDKVIRVLPGLLQSGQPVKYILGGKADARAREEVMQLINSLGLQEQVILAGFIPEKEVTDHYLLADVFVMPSKGEGFGIVYLEAMACGVPVIAGNKDGSTEALQFGKLGSLIDPDNESELQQAIAVVLEKKQDPLQCQQAMLTCFAFDRFCERLKETFVDVR